MDRTGGFYKGITGERRSKQTTRGMLNDAKKAFGTWKAVAREAGVSERTLRRIRATGKWTTSRVTRQKLDNLDKRQEVREAGIKPSKLRKFKQAAQNGARIKIKANQGPRGHGVDDYRRPGRLVEFDVPPGAMQQLLNDYEAGNDAAVKDRMAELVRDYGWSDWTPMNGWEFGTVDSFDWDPR